MTTSNSVKATSLGANRTEPASQLAGQPPSFVIQGQSPGDLEEGTDVMDIRASPINSVSPSGALKNTEEPVSWNHHLGSRLLDGGCSKGLVKHKSTCWTITQPAWGRSGGLLRRCWGHTGAPTCPQSGPSGFSWAGCPRCFSDSNSAFFPTQKQVGHQDATSFI